MNYILVNDSTWNDFIRTYKKTEKRNRTKELQIHDISRPSHKLN
jgi:hypothetical protein